MTCPFAILPNVFLADLRQQMKNLDLTLWSREYLSKHDVEKMQGWRYALIHRYSEEEYMHGEGELQSRDLLHKVFLGLRIVRPSKTPYQYLHARVKPDGSFDPSGFSRAEMPLTVFPCDSWAPVRRKDAELLRAITPNLLRVYETKCQSVRRAVNILEMGYISQFPDVKQLLWVTGLETLFTSAKFNGAPVLIRRLRQFLGSKTRVYEQANFAAQVAVPSLKLKDVLEDIYLVRNRLAHGEWIPESFMTRPGYALGAKSYADILLEATGIVLRMALIKILNESLLETFGDKDRLDGYFLALNQPRENRMPN